MLVSLLVVLVSLTAVYAACKRALRPTVKLPPIYPGALPIIGHAYKLIGRDSAYLYKLSMRLTKASLECGGVLLGYVGNVKYYIITDPEDFQTAANQCLKKHYYYYFLKSWLGEGMLTGPDVSIWKRHRKLLRPAFNQNVIERFLSVFNQQSRITVDELADNLGLGPFAQNEYLEKYALISICSSAVDFDDEDGALDIKSYTKAVQKIFHIITVRAQHIWMHNNFLFNFTKYKKQEEECSKELLSIYETILQKKRKRLNSDIGITSDTQEPTERSKYFIDLMLELSKDGELTDKEITEELNTLIVAGYETSANTLSYTLLLFGSYPQVQEKVYKELQSVFGASERDVEKQDMAKLVYLEAVLKESLRLYTFTPVMMRQVDRDIKLKNYTMPAGSSCFLFVCGVHRHPVWGADVEEFRPERWFEPALQSSQQNDLINKAYAPFGVGRRLCLGKTYAMISMKTILSHILRRYKITSDISKLELQLDPLLRPVSGHEISIELRKTE